MNAKEIMNLYHYPEEMKIRKNWVLWRLEEKDGRLTKVPYQVNGYRASSNKPDTWSSLEEVVNVLINTHSYSGIGFVFNGSADLIFIDIDHCVDEDGELNSLALDALEAFPDAFVELSQSQAGLHLFTQGHIPEAVKTKQIEMYASGRFCAMTGKIFRTSESLRYEQEALDKYFRTFKKEKPRQADPLPTPCSISLSDAEILQYTAKDRKFQKLYSGQWQDAYSSQSEADSALCMKLAFYCRRDPEAMDRIFRTSALYRPKWDIKHFSNGRTYGQETIRRACQAQETVMQTFIDYRRRREDEAFEKFSKSFFSF